MKKLVKGLLAAGMLAGMIGCHTCDVCDDCGDAPAARRPKVAKCNHGCGVRGCDGGCAGGSAVAAPAMQQVSPAR